MRSTIHPDLLAAYSHGEISRREIGDRLDIELSFGDLFGALPEQGLPLPRFPAHPASPGVQFIKRLAAQGLHGG